MARVNPFALYPPSFEDAVRDNLGVDPAPTSTAAPPKALKKRQPATRKTKTAKVTKKRKKK